MTKKKVIAVVVTTLALTAGSIGVAGAASKASHKVSVTKSSTRIVGQAGVGPEQALATILKDLVTKGTLTQAQSDAVTAAVTAAKAAHEAEHPKKADGGRGGHGPDHRGPKGGGMGGATAPKLPAPTATPGS
jgi:hypothetical protein